MLTNTVRIIGGKWRGKKLSFPSLPGLRPTPDRIRETVFNWLQFEMADARVLDLFAGSGAFGFEALSRGAAYVLFVEKDAKAAAQLKSHCRSLQVENVDIELGDVSQFLNHTVLQSPFDIVFVDPPYGKHLLEPCIMDLERHNLLTDKAFIYLEAESGLALPPLPACWHWYRSKQSGQVSYHLAIREKLING
jgi:16S rRNA (guanine966-N2)-methyltransferase